MRAAAQRFGFLHLLLMENAVMLNTMAMIVARGFLQHGFVGINGRIAIGVNTNLPAALMRTTDRSGELLRRIVHRTTVIRAKIVFALITPVLIGTIRPGFYAIIAIEIRAATRLTVHFFPTDPWPSKPACRDSGSAGSAT